MQITEKNPKTVTIDQVSNLAMVAGNEKVLTDVNLNGRHKHWFGFGWIDMGDARADLPNVVDA